VKADEVVYAVCTPRARAHAESPDLEASVRIRRRHHHAIRQQRAPQPRALHVALLSHWEMQRPRYPQKYARRVQHGDLVENLAGSGQGGVERDAAKTHQRQHGTREGKLEPVMARGGLEQEVDAFVQGYFRA